MPNDKAMDSLPLELGKQHRAGDVIGFPGGLVSYLAPMPLPTGQPAQDYAIHCANDPTRHSRPSLTSAEQTYKTDPRNER